MSIPLQAEINDTFTYMKALLHSRTGRMVRRLSAIVALATIASVAQANNNGDINLQPDKDIDLHLDEDTTGLIANTLESIVVSANRNETTRRMAPTLIGILDDKLFETTNSVSLAQGLNFQSGVRTENNCQNCGFQQVRINGLDGPYTQILIDSRPIFSALAGVYGLEQIPANMIERVEVSRGGGSALFGSSAIAGTINIITKEPKENFASVAHTLSGLGGTDALDNTTTLNASLVSRDHKAGIYIFGQNRTRGGYDADGDGFTELSRMKGQTLGFRSFLRLPKYHKITLEYHHIEEFRRGGDNIDRPPHEAEVAEQTEHSINTGSLKYDWYSQNALHSVSAYASAQHIHRNSYYGGGYDPNAYGTTTDLTWMVGIQYNYDFRKCLFMPARLTAGVEYNYDALDDNMLGYNRVIAQTTHIASVFLQNEWKTDRWSILVGGRLDKHNLIDHVIFSPRATLRYNPTPDINLRACWSKGFRAPQAFDEDLHVANVGGTVSMIRLADDLREEKSHSFSLSADMYRQWGRWQTNLMVEGFCTLLSDVFALRQIGIVDGILMNERYNEDGARVYGLNLEARASWSNKVQMQVGFTLQQAKYTHARQWSDDTTVPREQRIFRAPNTYGHFMFQYTPTHHLSLSLSGVYTGSMLVEHRAGYIDHDRAETTPHYMDTGFKAAYDFHLPGGVELELNAGVQNIFNSYQKDFDKGPDRDSGYLYGPSAPRTWFAGVKVNL